MSTMRKQADRAIQVQILCNCVLPPPKKDTVSVPNYYFLCDFYSESLLFQVNLEQYFKALL